MFLIKDWLKTLICSLIMGLGFWGLAYAADLQTIDAQIFSDNYANELEIETTARQETWKVDIGTKLGVATYEENADDIDSDYKVFYPELVVSAEKKLGDDIKAFAEFSFGHSLTAKENATVSNIELGSDMNFYRINVKGDIGKVFYFGDYYDLEVVPFFGYGFRFINFGRKNFTINNTNLFLDPISEKDYIHCLNLGTRFSKEINPAANISGLLSYARVVYNQAYTKEQGTQKGKGGYLVDGNLNLEYRLSKTWQLVFGGFVELQNLDDRDSGGDDNLNIYGAKAQMRAEF